MAIGEILLLAAPFKVRRKTKNQTRLEEFMFEKMILVVALSIVFGSTFPTAGELSPTVGQDPELRVFEGRVVDQEGKPIAGAAVEWGHFQSSFKHREVFRTDKDGRYRVETTRVGTDYRLGVSAPGFASHWKDRLIPKRADSRPNE